MERDGAAAVLAFIHAFNDQDLDRLATVLDPEVVIHSSRGPRRGISEALGWATRVETGELEQRIEVDGLRPAEDSVVAIVRRQWRWRDSGELAREDEVAWLFELSDGRISSWRAFEDRAAALAAAGAGEGAARPAPPR